MELTTYTVLLEDETVGGVKVNSCHAHLSPRVGDKTTVTYHDENGLDRKKTGIVKEVLESSDLF